MTTVTKNTSETFTLFHPPGIVRVLTPAEDAAPGPDAISAWARGG